MPNADNETRLAAVIRRTMDDLRRLAEEKDTIYLFYPMPYLKRNLARTIEGLVQGPEPYALELFKQENEQLLEAFDLLVQQTPNIHAIKPADLVCPSGVCMGKIGNTILYGYPLHVLLA